MRFTILTVASSLLETKSFCCMKSASRPSLTAKPVARVKEKKKMLGPQNSALRADIIDFYFDKCDGLRQKAGNARKKNWKILMPGPQSSELGADIADLFLTSATKFAKMRELLVIYVVLASLLFSIHFF